MAARSQSSLAPFSYQGIKVLRHWSFSLLIGAELNRPLMPVIDQGEIVGVLELDNLSDHLELHKT